MRRASVKDAQFVASRTLAFQSERRFDLVVALHACDTATDEAIAKGIQLGVDLILTVPCCQNQIRGQFVSGHPLTAMTEFGPIRYRLANMLTDALRAQFLRSAGYFVELHGDSIAPADAEEPVHLRPQSAAQQRPAPGRGLPGAEELL